jgi:hypothetical protein
VGSECAQFCECLLDLGVGGRRVYADGETLGRKSQRKRFANTST